MFTETQRTPGNPLNEGDAEQIASESARTGIPPVQLAWFGLARCLGSTHTIPDKENTE